MRKITRILAIKIIDYLSYFFLTIVVLLLLTMILFISTTVFKGNISFKFLDYFSFIMPKLSEGNFSLDIGDIMKIFAIISFIFFLLAEIVKFFLKKVTKKEIIIPLKKKIYLSSLIIVFFHLVAIFLIPYASLAGNSSISGFYFIFSFFLILSIISNVIYFLLIQFSRKLSSYF